MLGQPYSKHLAPKGLSEGWTLICFLVPYAEPFLRRVPAPQGAGIQVSTLDEFQAVATTNKAIHSNPKNCTHVNRPIYLLQPSVGCVCKGSSDANRFLNTSHHMSIGFVVVAAVVPCAPCYT